MDIGHIRPSVRPSSSYLMTFSFGSTVSPWVEGFDEDAACLGALLRLCRVIAGRVKVCLNQEDESLWSLRALALLKFVFVA